MSGRYGSLSAGRLRARAAGLVFDLWSGIWHASLDESQGKIGDPGRLSLLRCGKLT
jgi:hypothetical protein